MSQEFEIPPMGGENLPLSELKPQTLTSEQPVQPTVPTKKNNKVILLMILIVILAIVFGIALGSTLKPAKKPEVSPSPSLVEASPSALPSPSPESQNIKERRDSLQTKINEVDFKEQTLQPPVVDYKIRFKVKE